MRRLAVFLMSFCLFLSGMAFAGISIDIPKTVKQGGVIKAIVKIGDGDKFNGSIIFFNQTEQNLLRRVYTATQAKNINEFISLIPVGADEVIGFWNVCVSDQRQGICSPIEIQNANFPRALGFDFIIELSGEKKRRRAKEHEEIEKVYDNPLSVRYWNDELTFAGPLNSLDISSPFGTIRKKRFIPKKGRAVNFVRHHFGTDFLANIGTPVFAAESGIVRIAGKFSAEGNFLVIDHGNGIFTLYMHLSKFFVKEGDMVKRGQMTALSGNTGSSKGPHLHFEVRLHKIAVDPFEFLRGTK